MQPKISIIIPVYNVELYLWQCLDSIVNQTMRDIQIICVNDGSTDNSRCILQKYADQDLRIEIIDKPNGGLSSARNAAYSRIGGKYTLFVDSDDWIELDLCEKAYRKAEESNASMIIFFYHHEGNPATSTMYWRITPDDKMTVEEKLAILEYPTAWSKLWRTDFLLDNQLYFPDGLVFEDFFVHWKAVILANRIVILSELLYHYRYNFDSITGNCGKHYFDILTIFTKIRRFLNENGYYHLYKDQYHIQKLNQFYIWYKRSSIELQREFRGLIRENITGEDQEYYRDGKVENLLVQFYLAEIEGNPIAIMSYQVSKIVQMSEQILYWLLIKPIKKWLRVHKTNLLGKKRLENNE